MAAPTAGEGRQLIKQGRALRGPDGRARFYIRNAQDLDNAVLAVGRVRPNTDAARNAVRRFLIGVAKDMGLSSRIPDDWNADGSLKS